jgi:hypothetical protein
MTRLSLESILIIPHSKAIALAVNKLSPVTILTRTPASLQFYIALGTSSRKISFIPNKAIILNPSVSTVKTPFSFLFSKSIYSYFTFPFKLFNCYYYRP